MVIRTATDSDVKVLKDIWRNRFGDEDSFIDWYFNERFNPFHCSVCEVNERIVSCLYSIPVDVKIRDSKEKGILVSGVSTLPDYEGCGYMKQTFNFHLNRMKNAGFNVSILKAVDPKIYYSLEHRLINDVKYIYLKHSESLCKNVREVNIFDKKEALYKCFCKFSEKYLGFLLRTLKDFKTKCNEYYLTGAKCLAVFDKDNITGFCFYFEEDNKLYGEECVCLNQKAYDNLFEFMSALPYKEIKLRVETDVCAEFIDKSEITFGNSGYGINVQTLLSKCGLDGFSIEVMDPIIKENNGIFSLNGERVKVRPSLKLSNGFLMQWIFGYKSMTELINEGNAFVLNDDGIVEYMGSKGKISTLCLDEY